MGTTLVTYVGIGFTIPEDVLTGKEIWQITKKYDLLGDSSTYFYDYSGDTFIYIKRLTETYFGAHFNGLPAPSPAYATGEEWLEINGIQEELGFYEPLTTFVATSVG